MRSTDKDWLDDFEGNEYSMTCKQCREDFRGGKWRRICRQCEEARPSTTNLYALFNSKTRQLTSFTFDISMFPKSIQDNLLIKEFRVSVDQLDLNRFKWVGDYETGKLIDLTEQNKAIVTEQEVDEKYYNLFFNKFELETVLYELVLNTDMKTERGKAMQTLLSEILEQKKIEIEYFKNSALHIWESKEQADNRVHEAFKV